jgi:hypothetical protein
LCVNILHEDMELHFNSEFSRRSAKCTSSLLNFLREEKKS